MYAETGWASLFLKWNNRKLSHTGYLTNKFELEHKIEKGDWVTAWSDDIAETDVLQGVVAAGISVFNANPTAFLYWINELANRTISSRP